MRVHPAIAALRSDPARQRRANAVNDAAQMAWMSRSEVKQVRRDLARFAAGDDLRAARALSQLLTNLETAREFVDAMCGAFIEASRCEPLAHIPFRHASSAGFSRLVLFREGTAMLSLCSYEPLAQPREPETVRFADRTLNELVLAGRASAAMHTLADTAEGRACLQSQPLTMEPGTALVLQPMHEARHIARVSETLLALQLHRSSPAPQPSRDHRIADGALVGQASGDKRASDQVMALAVLGALEHRAGLSAMAQFARASARDPDARWEAVRQVLSLNSVRGFDLLTDIAAHPCDPLGPAAQALRDQLAKAHPQLCGALEGAV